MLRVFYVVYWWSCIDIYRRERLYLGYGWSGVVREGFLEEIGFIWV